MPFKRSSLVETCQAAHQSNDMVFLTYSTNRNTVKLPSSRNEIPNIAKWPASPIKQIKTTKLNLTATTKIKEVTIIILSRSTETRTRKDQAKGVLKKALASKAMLATMKTNTLNALTQESKRLQRTTAIRRVAGNTLDPEHPVKHTLVTLHFQISSLALNLTE